MLLYLLGMDEYISHIFFVLYQIHLQPLTWMLRSILLRNTEESYTVISRVVIFLKLCSVCRHGPGTTCSIVYICKYGHYFHIKANIIN